MEEIFQIRSCVEILVNDIKICTINVNVLLLIKNFKVCTVSPRTEVTIDSL